MFMGFFTISNLPTVLGLISALTACFLAGNGNVKFGIYMMFLACICDVINENIVKRTEKKTPSHTVFANQLIDLCKMAVFGIAPCFILFSFGFDGWFDTAIYCIYIACAAIRVSTQKTLELSNLNPKKKYKRNRGIPLSTTVYVLTFLFLLTTFIPAVVTVWFARIFLLALSVGFVLNIKIKRPGIKRSVLILGIELALLLILLVVGNCKAPIEESPDTVIEDVSTGETSEV